MENRITLYDLNHKIKNLISDSLTGSYWVVAEISEISINSNGHCYLELVEKDPDDKGLRARARAIIWSYTFRMLKPYFETTTKRTLEAGLKILVNCHVEFHEIYGLSLNIQDIDPSYTLGDLALKRQEVIKRLEQEGVINMNKDLPFPLVPQKIAVISSPTAAGYEDFVKQLHSNSLQLKFYHKLFPASMQGSEAEPSIIDALDKIYQYESFFDLVVIIRGGGSQADLSCFDSYWLAYHITQFPIPVITGIGHEKDESVADLVAYKQLKTPTATAEYLIRKCSEFIDYLYDLHDRFRRIIESNIRIQTAVVNEIMLKFVTTVQNTLTSNENKITRLGEKYHLTTKNYLRSAMEELNGIITAMSHSVRNRLAIRNLKLTGRIESVPAILRKSFHDHRNRLDMTERTADLLDPGHTMKRGYSVTYSGGKVVKDSKQVKPGGSLVTKYFKGKSISEIKKIESD